MRRMPYGDSIVNVGDLVGMESQGHLILRVDDEVEIGDVSTGRGCGQHSKKPSLMDRFHQIR
ncbi:hypothetical protein Acr_24g0006160 [Actinidia rufa]|uniref:Uncharacterized protein n=1 Tax=Actinidia rufa TaxID=165716 RepID=A0A7J0GUG7_9ERIC|nr:hypothetical protein Acr_24g0006160 [Actinidia rufa]